MAEEPSLPLLPTGLVSNSSFNGGRPTKRARLHDTSPAASSDPPLFSSDDDPSADNYSNPKRRQKMKYRGPWYKQEPDSAPSSSQQGERKAKRTFERQFDSAVWLGSDGTDGTDDDTDYEFLKNAPVPPFLAKGLPMAMRPSPLRTRIIPSREYPSQEDVARQQIEKCLDDGVEDIDLSSRDLTRLSNATVKPLASFSSIPALSQGGHYQPLLPTLRIYLASNELKHLPGEIFNLEHLGVLSVRNNELEELPAAIGRLRRLTELNASNNAFRYLPFELLDLLPCPSKLKILHLHPNPFYEPYASDDNTRSLSLSPLGSPTTETTMLPRSITCEIPEHDHSRQPEWKARFKCRSYVRFFDNNGTLLKGPQFFKGPDGSTLRLSNLPGCSNPRATRGRDIQVAPPDDVPEPPTARPASGAPSLLELCVKTWAKTPNMPNLDEYLGQDHPGNLQDLLENARKLRETEAAERKCTICERRFVIPRTEWIEWWEIERSTSPGPGDPKLFVGTQGESARSPAVEGQTIVTGNKRDIVESQVPFMRRGCSWRCLPER